MSTGYSSVKLPPFVPSTDGVAYPKPGAAVVFCRVPAATKIGTPWGQDLDCPAGTAHLAQDGVGDSYPNLEFDSFYEVGDIASEDDPRAQYLRKYWVERGYTEVELRLATKTRSAIVVGQVAQEACGLSFQNHEGTTPLEDGYILQSPDNECIRWFVRKGVFDKKYKGVEKKD